MIKMIGDWQSRGQPADTRLPCISK